MIDVVDSLPHRKVALTVAMTGCLAFPWLNPWASGPSPVVMPALVTFFCIAWMLVLIPTSMPSPVLVGVLSMPALIAGVPATADELFSVAIALTIFSFCFGAGFFVTRVGGIERCVAGAWLGASLLSSVIGLTQYFGIGDSFASWISPAKAGEAFANLRQRNQFATLTNIGQAALFWFVATRRTPDKNIWIAVAAAVLLSLGTAASASRTGLLQLGLLVSLLLLWRSKSRYSSPSFEIPEVGGKLRVRGRHELTDAKRAIEKVLAAAVGGYVLGAIALPWLAVVDSGQTGILSRFSEDIPQCASRMTLWTNAVHLIVERPWFGWGWGELDYAHYTTLYPGRRFCDILDNAHSLPLHFAVELGLPIALLICGGLGWAVWYGRPWGEKDPTRQMAWVVLAVIMLHSMLEYPLWYGPFQVAFGVCVGLLWRESELREFAFRGNPPMAGAVRLAFVSLLFVVIGYVAWDYHRLSQIYQAPQARDAAYRDDTMNKIRGSWIFRNQVRFAELTTTPLTRANAQWTLDTATALLHYSPEPRVIEKVIESAVMLRRDDEAQFHLMRYRAAFPREHALWRSANALPEGTTE